VPDTTAKIRAKGLDATGVTEELARQMHAHKGKHYMAIVELKVEEVHEKADGTAKVDLVLTQVEPATDTRLEDHLRELQRTVYFNRQLGDDQPLSDDDGPDPKIKDVIGQGAALIERDDDGQPVGLWDGDDTDGPAYDIDPEQLAKIDDVDLPDEPRIPEQRSNVVTIPFSHGQDHAPSECAHENTTQVTKMIDGSPVTGDRCEDCREFLHGQNLAEQPDGSVDESITDPHTYVDTPAGSCALCNQHADHHLHQNASA
jgi:hypothetical protein